MNKLQIFENAEFGKVRTIMQNNEIWFVGKDVAEALGYSNASKAIMAHVDDDDKHFEMIGADSQNRNVVTKTAFINESGVYALILKSKLSTTKKFKHWVTSEVLPSIRKHGAYATPQTITDILANPENAIKLLTTLRDEQERRTKAELTVEKQSQLIGELKPKADYVDTILQNKGLVTVNQIAADYGISPQAMNKKVARVRRTV